MFHRERGEGIYELSMVRNHVLAFLGKLSEQILFMMLPSPSRTSHCHSTLYWDLYILVSQSHSSFFKVIFTSALLPEKKKKFVTCQLQFSSWVIWGTASSLIASDVIQALASYLCMSVTDRSKWDLSFLIRDGTSTPCVGSVES